VPVAATVKVAVCPAVTVWLAGCAVIEGGTATGLTLRAAVCVRLAYDAEMVTAVDAVTALVVTVNDTLVLPAETVTLEGTVAVAALLLESVTCAPPAGAGPLRVTVPVDVCTPPTTLDGFNVSEESVGGAEGCSKTHTAGFGSLNGTITNFDGEITYATALPPDPEVSVTVPLPFVGDEEMEYVAENVAPDIGPLEAPMSSMPLTFPVGLAPSAVNSPLNGVTPNPAGVAAKPA
jgi:hypothetical protein